LRPQPSSKCHNLASKVGDSSIKGLGRDVADQAATLGLASGITSAGSALGKEQPAKAAEYARAS
jgi:hypothetical protein